MDVSECSKRIEWLKTELKAVRLQVEELVER